MRFLKCFNVIIRGVSVRFGLYGESAQMPLLEQYFWGINWSHFCLQIGNNNIFFKSYSVLIKGNGFDTSMKSLSKRREQKFIEKQTIWITLSVANVRNWSGFSLQNSWPRKQCGCATRMVTIFWGTFALSFYAFGIFLELWIKSHRLSQTTKCGMLAPKGLMVKWMYRTVHFVRFEHHLFMYKVMPHIGSTSSLYHGEYRKKGKRQENL